MYSNSESVKLIKIESQSSQSPKHFKPITNTKFGQLEKNMSKKGPWCFIFQVAFVLAFDFRWDEFDFQKSNKEMVIK